LVSVASPRSVSETMALRSSAVAVPELVTLASPADDQATIA
jgi:hypothetical protein